MAWENTQIGSSVGITVVPGMLAVKKGFWKQLKWRTANSVSGAPKLTALMPRDSLYKDARLSRWESGECGVGETPCCVPVATTEWQVTTPCFRSPEDNFLYVKETTRCLVLFPNFFSRSPVPKAVLGSNHLGYLPQSLLVT